MAWAAASKSKKNDVVIFLPKAEILAILFRWIDLGKGAWKGERRQQFDGTRAGGKFYLNRP